MKNKIFLIIGIFGLIIGLILMGPLSFPNGTNYKSGYDYVNIYKTDANSTDYNYSLINKISKTEDLEQLHSIIYQSKLLNNNLEECTEDSAIVNYVLEVFTKNHVRLFSTSISKCTPDQAIVMFASEKWQPATLPDYSLLLSKEDTEILMAIIE